MQSPSNRALSLPKAASGYSWTVIPNGRTARFLMPLPLLFMITDSPFIMFLLSKISIHIRRHFMLQFAMPFPLACISGIIPSRPVWMCAVDMNFMQQQMDDICVYACGCTVEWGGFRRTDDGIRAGSSEWSLPIYHDCPLLNLRQKRL